MVTKTQLEAEVANLRRQLAEQSKTSDPKQPQPDDHHETVTEKITDNLDAWTTQIEEVLTELEDLPQKKPILFALGVFALGYLIGRSR
ncbi:hypothetical protein [Ruegeria meonggei]|uniref:hypothetical protein n=1 Tax=Ruegeria meonggei TaxID=1446476 RepID=UPI00366CEC4A